MCASFETLLDAPENIDSCKTNYASSSWSQNPFRWPDPELALWPAP